MDLGISGRVALITGASGGIGLAVARQLKEEGVHLVLSDINPEKLEKECSALAHTNLLIAADMTRQDEVNDLVIKQGAIRADRHRGPYRRRHRCEGRSARTVGCGL